jgi:uncharacterized protein (TIGR02246 family)
MASATVPRAVTRAFTEALSAAELDRAASLFADDGCFITPDATAIRGRRGVRAVLAQLTAGHVQLRVTPGSVQMAGDMALCTERWDFTYSGRDTGPYTQVSESTVLLRRSDRGWQLSIVAPWHIVSADQDPFSSTPRLELAYRL